MKSPNKRTNDEQNHLRTEENLNKELARMHRTSLISYQNDLFRMIAFGDDLYCTPGFQALPKHTQTEAIEMIRWRQIFDRDNDPWCEHDFGTVQIEANSICWKIDYYDADRLGPSPDPTDDEVTSRVLTIMLASEY